MNYTLEELSVMANQRFRNYKSVFGINNKRLVYVKFDEKIPCSAFLFSSDSRKKWYIAFNPNWPPSPIELEWAFGEELSHIAHYYNNPRLFKEEISLHGKECEKRVNRIWEISNLAEFVGRLGSCYITGMLPPDYGETIDNWVSIASHEIKVEEWASTSGTTRPELSKDFLLASERVWGTALADYLICRNEHSGYPKGYQKSFRFRNSHEFLRSLTRCSRFSEITGVLKQYLPDSPSIDEAQTIADKLFP